MYHVKTKFFMKTKIIFIVALFFLQKTVCSQDHITLDYSNTITFNKKDAVKALNAATGRNSDSGSKNYYPPNHNSGSYNDNSVIRNANIQREAEKKKRDRQQAAADAQRFQEQKADLSRQLRGVSSNNGLALRGVGENSANQVGLRGVSQSSNYNQQPQRPTKISNGTSYYVAPPEEKKTHRPAAQTNNYETNYTQSTRNIQRNYGRPARNNYNRNTLIEKGKFVLDLSKQSIIEDGVRIPIDYGTSKAFEKLAASNPEYKILQKSMTEATSKFLGDQVMTSLNDDGKGKQSEAAKVVNALPLPKESPNEQIEQIKERISEKLGMGKQSIDNAIEIVKDVISFAKKNDTNMRMVVTDMKNDNYTRANENWGNLFGSSSRELQDKLKNQAKKNIP